MASILDNKLKDLEFKLEVVPAEENNPPKPPQYMVRIILKSQPDVAEYLINRKCYLPIKRFDSKDEALTQLHQAISILKSRDAEVGVYSIDVGVFDKSMQIKQLHEISKRTSQACREEVNLSRGWFY